MDGFSLDHDPTELLSAGTSTPDLFHAWEEMLLGMPHLSATGLSETWLLKELGHRHWLLLARSTGRSRPEFHDDRGAPVYAAFRAISIRGAAFERARENDTLRITSTLGRLSRTQVASHHVLTVDGQPLGDITMVSAFVRRREGGGNHAISRFMVEGLPPISARCPGGALAALSAGIQAGRIDEHLGFSTGTVETPGPSATYTPCPTLDFNGAGFLYFVSFIALVERFEWERDPATATGANLRDRDILFHGNIDPGDSVTVQANEWRNAPQALAHRCALQRHQDATPIATVFTRKT